MELLVSTLVREMNADLDSLKSELEHWGETLFDLTLTEEEGEILITRLLTEEEITECIKKAVTEVFPDKPVSVREIWIEIDYLLFIISM